MRGRGLLWLVFALLFGLTLSCGGPAPSVKGGIDADQGETEGGGASRARRQRVARSVKPQEIPLLSLEGLIPEPEAEAESEAEGEAEEPEGPAPPPGAPQKPPSPKVPPGSPPAAPQGQAQPPLPARNLFAFEEDPAVIAERQKQALAAAETARKAEELRRKWQGPPPPPPPPQPPPIPFQFAGYFGPPGDRTGVFTGAGEPGPKLAKKGDTLMSQFKIVDIGYESAEIGFKNFTETRRIPLSGGGK